MKTSHQSKDWLPLLLWTLETIINPYSATILQSFESWQHRNGFRREWRELRRAGHLQVRGEPATGEWRLSPQARTIAHGGIDPSSRWRRGWDGKWRLLLFDLPARQTRLRLGLWRWLRQQRFGYLQQSVWITPDAINETDIPLSHLKLTPESLTVIEGCPVAPDTSDDLVPSAWDFAAINRAYAVAMEIAAEGGALEPRRRLSEFRAWLAREREAWTAAVRKDPLLPAGLLPVDYLGRRALRQRQMTFKKLAGRFGEAGKT